MCYECGEKEMKETNGFILAADKAKDNGKKEFEYPKGSGKMHKVTIKKNIEVKETKQVCNECGSMLNEEGQCNECGVKYESKKIKLRLNENELISLINKIVNKTILNESVPGIEITNKSKKISGKNSKEHMSDVEKKMKKTLSFNGNDNPEFPKSISKGEKIAHRTTEKENETIEDFRGGLEDLNYNYEPSENFKNRMKEALEGSKKMGNSQDAANVIKSKTGENIFKKINRKKNKEKENFEVSWGHSWKDPEHTISVKESKEQKSKNSIVLNEEMNRMKEMFNYNKKTQ
jgi:hypothetical protein